MAKKRFKGLSGTRRDKPAGESEKITNILTILNLIEGGGCPSVQKLAEECQVSGRSIHRYLRIIEKVVPIIYDREKGGYRLFNPDALKVIPFKKEELAVLAAFSDVSSRMGEPVKGHFDTILKKFSACGLKEMPPASYTIMAPGSGSGTSWKWFEAIAKAITEERQIKISYHAVNTDEHTRRTIDPYGMAFYDGIWFVYAYCHLRRDFRTFALDRIESVAVTDKTFKKLEGFNLRERLSKAWGIWEGRETTVTVRFSKKIAEVIKRKPAWHPSEKRKILPDGGVELTFKISGTEELKWWLHSWTPHAEVIKPLYLRQEMREELTEAVKNYSDNTLSGADR